MTHPNDMTAWDDIACRRGHTAHRSRRVRVDLARPHGYADLPAVPQRLAKAFDMAVWDPAAHPVDGGPYCPAHDAVSETIINAGIWEPSETILTLAACSAGPAGSWMVDFGSQVGWFSLLAASCGLGVLAIEADEENRRLHTLSNEANDWGGYVSMIPERIGPDTPALDPVRHITLAKIDVEGAERDAIRMLWPSIEAGMVDHLLVEITPVFADFYGSLVIDLVDAGFQAWVLPNKSIPPAHLDDLPGDLELGRISDLSRLSLDMAVNSWHQEMVWFSAPHARW